MEAVTAMKLEARINLQTSPHQALRRYKLKLEKAKTKIERSKNHL